MWRWVLPVAVAAALLIGFLASRNGPTSHVGAHAPPTTTTTPTAPGPHLDATCGSLTGTAAVRHVVWIWMGGQSYKHIIGKVREAPYINQLAGQCGLASAYSTITHPAIANDVGVLAGDPHGLVHNACSPCIVPGASLLTQVPSWRAFIGGMPTPCRKLAAAERYSRLSNPPSYLTVPGCPRFDLPLGTPTGGRLAQLLTANTMPAFTMIVPDGCHDTGFDKHCGGVKKRGAFIARGDTVAARLDPGAHLIARLPVGLDGDLHHLEPGHAGQAARTSPAPPGRPRNACRVPLLVISPYVKAGINVATRFSHYSLLRATEKLLGIKTQLGNAGRPAAGNLVQAFGL